MAKSKIRSYELPMLDRRVVVEFRDTTRPTVIIGAINANVRTPSEFMTLDHPTFGPTHCSLIRVTPRLVWYREVMRDAAVNEGGGKIHFNPAQE